MRTQAVKSHHSHLGLGLAAATVLVLSGCVVIEPLPFKKAVISKQGAKLWLADETILQLPGVLHLRDSTPFLDAACKRGARLKNGRPVGQMKIWHWCGNDIVRYHLARVDLAHLVLFAGEGIPSEPIQTPEREVRDDALTKRGWRMEQYYRFRKWEARLDELRGRDGD